MGFLTFLDGPLFRVLYNVITGNACHLISVSSSPYCRVSPNLLSSLALQNADYIQ